MPTLHTLHRSGRLTITAIPRRYNVEGLAHCDNGRKEKTYGITNKNRHTILSSLSRMWHERNHNLTFWTYTFKLDENTKNIVTDQQIMNKYFSKLIENTKKNYGLKKYVWVSERTKQGTIHYHCIFDIPYMKKETKFQDYAKYFKSSFIDLLVSNNVNVIDNVDYSSIGFPPVVDRNGIRRGSVVRCLESLATYLGTYISKRMGRDGRERSGRVYAISRNTIEHPTKSYGQLDIPFLEKKQYIHQYCTVKYYKLNRTFDDFYLTVKDQKPTMVLSDLARKLTSKHRYATERAKFLHTKNTVKTQKTQFLQKITLNKQADHNAFTQFCAYIRDMSDELFDSQAVDMKLYAKANNLLTIDKQTE